MTSDGDEGKAGLIVAAETCLYMFEVQLTFPGRPRLALRDRISFWVWDVVPRVLCVTVGLGDGTGVTRLKPPDPESFAACGCTRRMRIGKAPITCLFPRRARDLERCLRTTKIEGGSY